MKLTPLFDNVVIKPDEAETKTASGIYLPDNAKKEEKFGTINAIGPGRNATDGKLMPMVVKVGQRILYKKGWSDTALKLDGEEWVVVGQDAILAVVEK